MGIRPVEVLWCVQARQKRARSRVSFYEELAPFVFPRRFTTHDLPDGRFPCLYYIYIYI